MIEARNLYKTYHVIDKEIGLKGSIQAFFKPKKRSIQAVKNISLSVKKGEIIGYIGANGSGKSTTIKMLTGILQPDQGQIKISGLLPHEHRKVINKKIGVLFGQKSHLNWDIPVIDSFILHGKIYNVPKELFQERLDRLIQLLDLSAILKQPIRNLSLGQRVRCEFAAIFLHQPDLVFLDEPTIGLDATVKESIRDFIRFMNQHYQTTFLITSHDMKDIESLCERIFIIDAGEKVYDGSLENLRQRFSKERVISFTSQTKLEKEKSSLPDGLNMEIKDSTHFDIRYQSKDFTSAEVISFLFERYPIEDVQIQELEIEQIVRQIYQEGLHE